MKLYPVEKSIEEELSALKDAVRWLYHIDGDTLRDSDCRAITLEDYLDRKRATTGPAQVILNVLEGK